MSTRLRSALSAYSRVDVETGVHAADAHRLVMMLFDGAKAAIATARLHLHRGDRAARGEAISKAILILEQGLRASLDPTAGGELAGRLDALYVYMCQRLALANLREDAGLLDEVTRLVGELAEAWAAMRPRPQ